VTSSATNAEQVGITDQLITISNMQVDASNGSSGDRSTVGVVESGVYHEGTFDEAEANRNVSVLVALVALQLYIFLPLSTSRLAWGTCGGRQVDRYLLTQFF